MAAKDDVVPVAERPLLHGRVQVEGRDHALAGPGIAHGLEDGVVGEEVSGYAKPMEDGKTMAASSLTFGPKPETKAPEKKKEKEPEKK